MELSIAMVESRRRQQKGAPEQDDAAPASPETSVASGEAKPAIAGSPQVSLQRVACSSCVYHTDVRSGTSICSAAGY